MQLDEYDPEHRGTGIAENENGGAFDFWPSMNVRFCLDQ
jgi:hypothetical protein